METEDKVKPPEQELDSMSPSDDTRSPTPDPAHTVSLQYFAIALGTLFFFRLILPFLTLLVIFFLAFSCVIIIGVVVVSIPKHDETNLRTQFPRLKFTRPGEWDNGVRLIRENEQFVEPEWSTPFNVAADRLVHNVIRDFIMTWFRSISQSPVFPNEVRLQIRRAFFELEKRAYEVDVSRLLVLEIVPILTRHMKNVSMAEGSVVGEKNISGSTELELKVAKEYDSISKLHPCVVLKSSDTEKDKKTYAQDRIGKIVTFLLPKEELSSGPVQVLIREILTNTVMFPVLRLLSDSDFWNQMIVKFSSATLKDRDQVRELRHAIEEQYNNPNSKLNKPGPHGPLFDYKITPQMKQPSFQKYIKTIDKSDSLSSLKQLKYYVAVQISRTHRIHSESERFVKYTKRLNIAKERIDKRIETLSSRQNTTESINRDSSVLDRDVGSFISSLTLTQILGNPSSLSFFMEFMEQRSRTKLLQYWLTVQGIKDPLEDPHNPDYEEELSSSMDISGGDDIEQIFKTFFSEEILRISEDAYTEVEDFATGKERSMEKYLRVRKLILVLQVEVFKRMEDRDLPDFKGSDLFLKLLASESFEQSLVNQVDGLPDEWDGLTETVDDQDTGDGSTNDGGLSELENALTDILNKDHDTPRIPSVNSSDMLSKKSAEALKGDLFGSEEKGFLDQRPLFDDSDAEELGDDELDDDDDKLSADPNFFPPSHDALNMKEEIAQLDLAIERLTKQSEMLDPLILKAELTNNAGELRLLRKSKSSYQREIESKELLKQQLIVQENENSLFGKTNVVINSWIKSHSNSGRDFIVYVIEVEKTTTLDGEPTTWMVGRRFNQFFKLNEILKQQCPEVESIPFPKKKLVLTFQQKSVLDERRSQLEQYLSFLLKMPKVCQNKEFRKFLTAEEYRATPSVARFAPTADIKDAATKIYTGLSSGMFSKSATNLKAVEDLEDTVSEHGSQAEDMRKELESYDVERAASKSFVKPITDLFLALFPLNSTNSWLRGRAIIVVLQQVLGSTIEKHIKGQVANNASEERMIEALNMLQGILWPDGQFMKSGVPRTPGEKLKSKREAKLLLETLMVDTLSKFVGQSGSKTASARVYGMMQNEILNTNLVYNVLDTVFGALFPELNEL